jgi:hypothetical protein
VAIRELYDANLNYGDAEILRRYSGFEGPIPAVIPHGVQFDTKIFPGEAGARPKSVLSWPVYRDAAWAPYKHVVPSAAPFLYALALAGEPDPAVEREGTLFVPQHSVHIMNMDVDWRGLARSLRDLEGPVTVQMYWRDIELGHDRFFKRAGYEVVCAGGGNDRDFFFNVIKYVRTVKYACSNNIGSHVFYALSAGVPYFLAGERANPVYCGSTELAGFFMASDAEKSVRSEIEPLFRERLDHITGEQKTVADYFLGAGRFKTPEGLLADLQECAAVQAGFPVPEHGER